MMRWLRFFYHQRTQADEFPLLQTLLDVLEERKEFSATHLFGMGASGRKVVMTTSEGCGIVDVPQPLDEGDLAQEQIANGWKRAGMRYTPTDIREYAENERWRCPRT
uniref:Uncharacterized protein n=1 Tax=Odontella aurita TaxID=265563 RepID=A0A7S4N4L4_9STRA|mmetsp:Transcript_47173/g.142845  ORF Transcript_47173/g.142845 Transcript_47173/m.142845 type:complete len:107 (+) Transcript_47173:691-1011(+)